MWHCCFLRVYLNKHYQSCIAGKYCILLVSLLLLLLLSLLCIICAVVFIVVVVECLHSAGLAFNVLSSGLAFNVLSSGLAFNVLSSGLAFNVLLLLHFSGLVVQCSGLVVQCAVIANSYRPTDRHPKWVIELLSQLKKASKLVFCAGEGSTQSHVKPVWFNLGEVR